MRRFAANTQIKLLFYLVMVVSVLYFVQDKYGLFEFENSPVEQTQEQEKKPLYVETQNGERFNLEVEVARSQQERAVGLMNRESLAKNAGMLFIFEEDSLSGFWMKDVRFPLDIIFADGERKIVYIEHEAPPCESSPCSIYNPGVTYRYVVEVNGGWAQEKGIEIGDSLNLTEITSGS